MLASQSNGGSVGSALNGGSPQDDSGDGSYLEWLREDSLLAVLRKLSVRPLTSNWRARIRPNDALSILQCGGSMADCLRKELAVVGLGLTSRRILPDSDPILYVNSNDPTGQEIFEAIVSEVGDSLQRLSTCSSLVFRDHALLERSCVNLTSFCLKYGRGGILTLVLKVCSGKLRNLDIEGTSLIKSDIDAIAAHCIGLEKLRIDNIVCSESLERVWMALSTNLLDLTFEISSLGISEGTAPAWKFEKLRDIEPRYYRSPELLQLCLEIGSNLKQLRLLSAGFTFDTESFKRLLQACPNVVVESAVYDLETLLILGGNIRALQTNEELFRGSSIGGESISNLQELILRWRNPTYENHHVELHQFFSALLSSPKPLLKSLKLLTALSDICVPVVDLLAQKVSTLEKLGLTLNTSDIPLNYLRNLASANQSLRKVYVELRTTQTPHSEEELVSILSIFMSCPQLEHLSIVHNGLVGRSEKVADACASFRHSKVVDIVIGNVSYGS